MKAEVAFLVLSSALGQGAAFAGDAAPAAQGRSAAAKDEKSKEIAAGRRLDELRQAAAEYQITPDSAPTRKLVLVPEPVLHWTNPLRKTFDGAVFIWVADGRPEVAASFYRYSYEGEPREDHEFQSLAATGLTATRDGQKVWTPPMPGITLAPIPGAPAPASTPAERLRQMRALAHEFHAFFDNVEDKSELRLLPKPLYRYATNRPGLLDGALFAFVVTTDPEVLLAIEARPVAGAAVWHYGFARMSMVSMRAQHKDQSVWKVEWVYDLQAPDKPYVTLRAPDRHN
jgi:hypothetical protein